MASIFTSQQGWHDKSFTAQLFLHKKKLLLVEKYLQKKHNLSVHMVMKIAFYYSEHNTNFFSLQSINGQFHPWMDCYGSP